MSLPSSPAATGGGDFGTPSGGGGRRVTVSMPRLTNFEWFDARVAPQRVVTPADGEQPKELTPIEYVRACVRMDDAKEDGDKRPTLVFFHWPHEHAKYGEATKDLCTKALDDETAARWGHLFRCVQVDMSASDAKLVALLGADGSPSLVVLDNDTKVVARIPAMSNAGKMQKALKDAVLKFPERWKQVQKDVEDQAKQVAEAKRLLKADHPEEALSLLNPVRMSDVRIGDAFNEAVQMAGDAQQKIDRAKAQGK